jgi:glycosyltransferase involved in cell wall biosynthesis
VENRAGSVPTLVGEKASAMISVVIPVYMQDEYLEACLESIVSQSVNNLEIIGVVDGFSARTTDIFDRWEKADPRIRHVVTEHAGLGHARRTGLDLARGDYLAFCDADDTLPPDAYHCLLAGIEKENADVVTGHFTQLFDDGSKSVYGVPRGGDEVFTAFFEYPMVWNRLFRMNFLRANRLTFPRISQGDDLLFMADLYLSRPQCVSVSNNVYFWHRHEADKVRTLSRRQDAREFIELLESHVLFMEKLMSHKPGAVLENLRESCDSLLHRFRILDAGPVVEAFEKFKAIVLCLKWEEDPVLFRRIFGTDLVRFAGMSCHDLHLYHIKPENEQSPQNEDNCLGTAFKE